MRLTGLGDIKINTNGSETKIGLNRLTGLGGAGEIDN